MTPSCHEVCLIAWMGVGCLAFLIVLLILRVNAGEGDESRARVTDFGEVDVASLLRGDRFPILRNTLTFARMAQNTYSCCQRDVQGWRPLELQLQPSARLAIPLPLWKTKLKTPFLVRAWIRGDPSIGYQAVLAFRGTDSRIDWYSNFRWVTRAFSWFVDDHYHQTRNALPLAIAQLDAAVGASPEVVAVGHSLGGGLAQYAVYLNDRVSAAVCFNSSPVTGWSSLRPHERRRTVRGEIFRIYEGREVLAHLRWLMKAAYLLQANSFAGARWIEIRLTRADGVSALARHSMKRMVERLERLAAQGSATDRRI